VIVVLDMVKLLMLASLQLTLGLVGAEAIENAEFCLFTLRTGRDLLFAQLTLVVTHSVFSCKYKRQAERLLLITYGRVQA